MVRQPCLLARISILAPAFGSAYHKPPGLDPPKCSFFLLEPSFASAKRRFPPAGKTKTGKLLLFSDFHKHLSRPDCLVFAVSSHFCYPVATASASIRRGHAHELPPCEMALCQHRPVVPRVLDQSAARLHQPLLQTGQRPVLNLLRQHQPPPEVAQVVGDEA